MINTPSKWNRKSILIHRVWDNPTCICVSSQLKIKSAADCCIYEVHLKMNCHATNLHEYIMKESSPRGEIREELASVADLLCMIPIWQEKTEPRGEQSSNSQCRDRIDRRRRHSFGFQSRCRYSRTQPLSINFRLRRQTGNTDRRRSRMHSNLRQDEISCFLARKSRVGCLATF